jgi:nitronate monooxygenase
LVTNLMTGGLARGLHGRLIDELGPVRAEVPPYPLASAALAPIRAAAEKQGEYSFGPMWAGQAAALGQSLPAAELTRKLAADALAILGVEG